MKTIQYLGHFNEPKPNIKEAFIKGVRLGMYIGGAIVFLILLTFKLIHFL